MPAVPDPAVPAELLRTITFLSTAEGKLVLEALTFLRILEDQRKPNPATAPPGVVNPAWRSLVVNADDKVDRHASTFCARGEGARPSAGWCSSSPGQVRPNAGADRASGRPGWFMG
ncbi:MAG: hypothetical protein M3069_03740 [Chloroflexota bacterium]|nr:hypothetical protein [Chloroflexota bacterium]